MNTHNSYFFPLNSLPVEIQNTVWTVERAVQSPVPLIAASTLSTMAIACQGLVDVLMPTGQVAPTSMFFITAAESGERKTATDGMLIRPILTLQSQWAAIAADQERELAIATALWQIEQSAIETKIRRAVKGNNPCDELRAEFKEHARRKPQPSQRPHILYSDTTPEALLFSLHNNWPNAALVSSEGGSVLNGHAVRQLGVLNQIWDGSGSIRVDRKTETSIVLEEARLSLSIMVQRKPFQQFLSRNGGEAWETGFLSRVLISEPLSRQGERYFNGPQAKTSNDGLAWFHARTEELLRGALTARELKRPREVLGFTPEAAREWVQFANHVEANLVPGNYCDDMRGFASKLSNHMSRLAAVLHFFCGKPGPIDGDSTRAAIRLAYWYTDEHKRLFGTVDGWSTKVDLGRRLVDWLWRRYKGGQGTDCTFNEIYRCGPNPLRKRADLELALEPLQSQGAVSVFRTSRPAFIRLVIPAQ